MFKNIMLALERIERRQRLLLSRLDEMAGGPRKAEWLCGERTSGAARKPCCLQRGDGCGACEDELERLEELKTPHPSPAATPSPQGEGLAAGEWVQKGIDNILAYQVGKKRGEQA